MLVYFFINNNYGGINPKLLFNVLKGHICRNTVLKSINTLNKKRMILKLKHGNLAVVKGKRIIDFDRMCKNYLINVGLKDEDVHKTFMIKLDYKQYLEYRDLFLPQIIFNFLRYACSGHGLEDGHGGNGHNNFIISHSQMRKFGISRHTFEKIIEFGDVGKAKQENLRLIKSEQYDLKDYTIDKIYPTDGKKYSIAWSNRYNFLSANYFKITCDREILKRFTCFLFDIKPDEMATPTIVTERTSVRNEDGVVVSRTIEKRLTSDELLYNYILARSNLITRHVGEIRYLYGIYAEKLHNETGIYKALRFNLFLNGKRDDIIYGAKLYRNML